MIIKGEIIQSIATALESHVPGRDEVEGVCTSEISRDTVQRVLSYLIEPANGFKAVPGFPQQTVDVSIQESIHGPAIRYTLKAPFVGHAIPKKGNKGLIDVIRKERIGKAIEIPEFCIRFNVKRETPLDKESDSTFSHPLVAGPTRGPGTPRTYRHKKRWSFIPEDSDDFRIDVTAVRQTVQSGRAENPLTYNEIMMCKEKYEVEVEYTGKDALKGKVALEVAKSLIGHFSVILMVIDDTEHLLSVSEQKNVIDQYNKLLDKNLANKFIGPKPITLELEHLSCENNGTPCVSQDYTVTDKADGERRLLFVAEDKRVYTINNMMFVRDTGRVMRTMGRCILDGEHLPDRFLVFDAMFYNGKDVRNQPLHIFSNEDGSKTTRKRTHGGNDLPSDRLKAARAVVSDLVPPAKDDYLISVKEFKESRSSRSLAEACRNILHKNTSNRLPYNIDGLIFTPASLPMPKGGRWPETLKWKPPHENSIDFKVRLHPDLVVVNNVPHRVADLLVGQDPWLSVKLTTLEMISGSAINRLKRGGSYTEVPFHPPGDESDPPVHVCYIPMNNGRMQCKNKDEIVDGSVVEFSYDNNANGGLKWVPMNVRWDKTVANNSDAADNVWRTILNPVTQEMLTNPEVASAAIKRMKLSHNHSPTSYYVSQLKSDDGDSGGLRDFHNYWVKNKSLLMRFQGAPLGRSVFDFGCGRGGDLHKWLEMGVERVMGIDKYSSNIYEPAWNASPSANVRLLKARGQTPHKFAGNHQNHMEEKARKLKAVFLPMDASMPITSQAYIDSLDEASGDRAVARCLWGLDPYAAVSPAALKTYHCFAKNAFDLASCMFAIHYFFDKKESLSTFCGNVAAVLRDGGHFVGCCMDGDAVDAMLNAEAPKVGDSVVAHGKNESVTWSVTRSYASGRKTGDRYGRQIDVFVESIGQTFPEYLVDYGDLVAAMAEHGLRPADEEASTLGLCGGKSTGMFEELFEDMKDKNKGLSGRDLHPKVSSALSMSPEEKKYSWLHRWFVFVK